MSQLVNGGEVDAWFIIKAWALNGQIQVGSSWTFVSLAVVLLEPD